MPRPHLIRSETHAYHVTSRCNNKQLFPLPLHVVWNIFLNELKRVNERHDLQVHAFVLMNNHFHLLCHTPKANLDESMRDLLRRISVTINLRAGFINQLWGGRYHWSLIESENYYRQVYKYIMQNPVRAGAAKNVEDYPYSTVSKNFSMNLNPFIDLSDLAWLNQPFLKDSTPLIQQGLKKSQFGVTKRRRSILDKEESPKSKRYLAPF